jgi:hypothetical protein
MDVAGKYSPNEEKMINKEKYENGWIIIIEGWGIRIKITRWKNDRK